MDTYEVTTLQKGLLILELLRKKHSLTMSEVMLELGLNKSTAYRMLFTLEKMNYVIKRNKFYHLNPHVFRDERIDSHKGVQWTTLETPYLLARDIGESVYIGILDQQEVVMKNVIKEPFTQPFFSAIDKRSPVHSSAVGKVILAHLSKEQQRETLNFVSLDYITEHSFIDEELFLSHLNVIKGQGYAVDDEETNLGKRCIAAPVYVNNEVIGAIAIHGPIQRIKKYSLRSVAKKVIAASKQVTIEIE